MANANILMAGKTENVEKENKLCTCGHWASSHDFSHCGECRADEKCGCKSFTEEKKFRDANEYAIFHELRCVDLRLSQINGYLEKIDLLCRGRDYQEVNKLVVGIKTRYEFTWKRYNELKKAMEKKNGVGK